VELQRLVVSSVSLQLVAPSTDPSSTTFNKASLKGDCTVSSGDLCCSVAPETSAQKNSGAAWRSEFAGIFVLVLSVCILPNFEQ